MKPPRSGLPRRRELRGQALGHELEHALRPVDVLQLPLAEITQAHAARHVLVNHFRGRTREQNLPAACGPGDPGATMQADAVIALLAHDRLACVKTHTDTALDTVGPLVRSESALAVNGRLDRVPRASERDEKRVALRIHLAPSVSSERLP